MVSFQAIICWNWQKKREIKIIVLFHSVPTRRVKENSLKIAKKIQKIRKIQLWLLFKQKLVGNGREREKIQIIVSFRS